MTPVSYFEPLADAPSLTTLILWGPEDSLTYSLSLAPLARCTRLRRLIFDSLALHVGELSGMFMQLARAGGQLQVLQLANLWSRSMDDAGKFASWRSDALGLELVFASPYLQHLHTLTLCGHEVGSLEYVPCLPSLRQLHLWLSLLPSAPKLALLLSRLPHLHCTIQPHSSEGRPEWRVQQQNEAMLPQLIRLAQQCSRLVLGEFSAPPVEEEEDE
jgi:hypothetical protein